jgi:hypothetical protein
MSVEASLGALGNAPSLATRQSSPSLASFLLSLEPFVVETLNGAVLLSIERRPGREVQIE